MLKNYWYTRADTNLKFGALTWSQMVCNISLLILNKVIHSSFTRYTHFLSANVQRLVNFTVSAEITVPVQMVPCMQTPCVEYLHISCPSRQFCWGCQRGRGVGSQDAPRDKSQIGHDQRSATEFLKRHNIPYESEIDTFFSRKMHISLDWSLISWTHYELLTPYGDTDLGQHCLRQWLVAWQHYLNQCWLFICKILWHSPDHNFSWNVQDFENY